MLTHIPLSFIFCFDPRAVDQEIQRTGSSAIGQADVQRFLTVT
jgi:hypothetical protein